MEAVIHQQADLITQWMRVGFIHGVMNTDNMALCGETIDYGPCAFMDTFAPDTVFSSIDHRGRYAYANQPYIAQWNLARLAETLLAFIDPDRKKAIEIAENCLNSFEKIYKEKWLTMMGSKIGLKEKFEGDEKLISELLDWMHKNSADFTNTFINLGKEKLPDFEAYATKDFQSWHSRWQERIRKEKQDRTATLAFNEFGKSLWSFPEITRLKKLCRLPKRMIFNPFTIFFNQSKNRTKTTVAWKATKVHQSRRKKFTKLLWHLKKFFAS